MVFITRHLLPVTRHHLLNWRSFPRYGVSSKTAVSVLHYYENCSKINHCLQKNLRKADTKVLHYYKSAKCFGKFVWRYLANWLCCRGIFFWYRKLWGVIGNYRKLHWVTRRRHRGTQRDTEGIECGWLGWLITLNLIHQRSLSSRRCTASQPYLIRLLTARYK